MELGPPKVVSSLPARCTTARVPLMVLGMLETLSIRTCLLTFLLTMVFASNAKTTQMPLLQHQSLHQQIALLDKSRPSSRRLARKPCVPTLVVSG